ncbi:unnamed protein product, partial [Ixodes pacificus]
MGLNCGIVGLPNVGKSTLFNALTHSTLAEVANYPFCTIEPNVGKAIIRDSRLKTIASIANSQKIVFNHIECVDIAGLVSGASSGEGLGNKFLGHIREVDAIIHVLRCFEDQNVSHVSHSIDPVRDAETVEIELILADIESLQRRLLSMTKSVKSGKEPKSKLELVEKVLAVLEGGSPARSIAGDVDPVELKQLQLLSSKPVMYVCNVEEDNARSGNSLSELVRKMTECKHDRFCCLSAKLEAEVLGLEEEERLAFLSEAGLQESGLDTVVKAVFDLLNLITFFTVGPKEARAWS